ncbi:hypothetical protein [Nocardia jejuensis]|uniref:hypothetical protein n=1 Tax=Nocardia jejuensis TaxID=328049 RepID=UPI00082A8A86|nr:hypothetical protein [Nocardia jejuensis]
MRLQFLGKGGSNQDGCPTLYVTDKDTFVVQGWTTDEVGTVEIPHLLLGFTEARTFIDSPLIDTGRGTFAVAGDPITDRETLEQLTLAGDESAIEVRRAERTFFGGISPE